jgi:hypothetical protein
MAEKGNRSSWATAANIATVLSIFLSIAAIILSLLQFNRSLEELYRERKLRNEENRPLMAIDSSGINIYNFITEYGEKPSWSYTLRFINVGVRPAIDIQVKSWVVGRSFALTDTTYDASGYDSFDYPNSLPKDVKLDYVGGIDITPKNFYFLKVMVKYKDPLTKNSYQEVFYYRADTSQALRYKYDTDEVTETYKSDVAQIDSLIRKLYEH